MTHAISAEGPPAPADLLRERLGALVENLNANTDPIERIELHAEIVQLCGILAGGAT